MKKINFRVVNYFNLFVLSAGVLFFVVNVCWAGDENWDEYESFLRKYTKLENNQVFVNYSKILDDKAMDKVLSELSRNYDRAEITEKHKLTFYINAYNIMAINLIVDNWEVDSIKDIGGLFSSVWGKEAGMIAGKGFSLDEIEHEILRRMGEPRVHFSLVCASIGCPNLRREPYKASHIYEQLEDQTINFLSKENKGAKIQGDDIYISMIFKWFSEDFESSGGVLKFISNYLPLNGRNLNIKYLDYDWRVNSY